MKLLLRLGLQLWNYVNKHYPFSLLAKITTACASVVLVVYPTTVAFAGFGEDLLDAIVALISRILYFMLIYVMGAFASLGANLIIYTANFTQFTTHPIVIEGWSLVRDISNMFFIVLLLVIAFGTLLRLEAYSWKKLLPKMILAAVLVNYSRAIAGFMVDAAQVVMLTFVAAISPAVTQGIVQAFQLNKLLAFREPENQDEILISETDASRLLAIVAAGIMLSTLVIIELVYAVILIGRLVFIWFLTVLAPLAFACSALPATEKYYRQWWEMFGRYVTVGPLMMFFLWLGLYIAAKSTQGLGQSANPNVENYIPEDLQNSNLSLAKSLDINTVVGFIISSMMLSAGLKMAQDNASEMGSITSKASSVGQWISRAPLKYGGKALWAGVKTANDRSYARWGLDLNLSRQYENIKHKRHEIQTRREREGRVKAGRAAQSGNAVKAWLGAADFAYEQYMPVVGVQGFLKNRNSMLRRPFAARAEKSALGDLDQAEKTAKTADAQLQAQTTSAREKYKTEDQFRQGEQAAASTAAYYGGVNMANLDTTNAQDRQLLEDFRSKLVNDRDDAYAQGKTADGDAIQADINDVKAALDASTTGVNLTGLGGAGELRNFINAKLAAAQDEHQRYTNPAKANAYKSADAAGRRIISDEVLKQVINQETKAAEAAKKAAEEQVKTAKKKAAEYKPVMDFESISKAQALVSEAMKEYHDENNEDRLVAVFQEKMHEKDGTYALAALMQATKVGHTNEILKAQGLTDDVDGMRELARMIVEQTGIDEQQVMATMNDVSRVAESNGHWKYAQAITHENGRYKFRDKAEQYLRVEIEASKSGGNNVARRTHLAAANYYKDEAGTYRPRLFYPAVKVIVDSMPQMVDSSSKGMLNPQLGYILFNDQSPEGQRNRKTFFQMIEDRYGSDKSHGSPYDRAMQTAKNWQNASLRLSAGGDTLAAAQRYEGMLSGR